MLVHVYVSMRVCVYTCFSITACEHPCMHVMSTNIISIEFETLTKQHGLRQG